MTSPSKPLCYDCHHPLSPGQERCPLCGAFVRAEDREEKIRAELHKDRWSAPPEHVGRAMTISTASPAQLSPVSNSQRPSRPPVAVGFEGHRGRMQKFDATMGVNVGQLGAQNSAPPSSRQPARTLAGMPMPQGSSTNELGTRAMAWQPVSPPIVRSASQPPPKAILRDSNPTPSTKLEIESHGLGRDRVSQAPVSVRRAPSGQRTPSGGVRFVSLELPYSLSAGLLASSIVLLLTWLTPDLFQPPYTMPAQLVSLTHGLDLVGLLGVPLAGSLLLALAVAPFADALRSIIGLFFAIGAMSSTVLLAPLLLPLDEPLVLVAALSMVVVAALAHRLSSWPVIGHVVAGALPMALLVAAIAGYMIGRFPLTYAAAFKPSLLLWALIHSATLCLAALIWPLGRGERP